jgi:hypothetical protein
MTTIPRLPSSAVDYLRAFNIRAVAIAANGHVFSSDNPTGAVSAWWTRRDDALRLAKVAAEFGLDVVDAAAQMKMILTPHDVVIERVRERTARLDEALAAAQQNGLLKNFNATFRKRRLTAQKAGKRFLSYSVAQRRLRQAITEAIAAGGVINKSLVNRALSR